MWPNFFIIGAGKAGTTSLYYYLKQHPQIFMSKAKEPKFFALKGHSLDFRGPHDERIRSGTTTELSDYLALFREARDAIAIGEASTIYLDDERAPGAIAARVPGARLVAILRHPAERAFSAFQHLVRDRYEPLPTFEEGLAAEEQRMRDGWYMQYEYKGRGFYARSLKRYLARFDPARIRIYLYEDFVERPLWLLSDLFGFLGVDPDFTPDISTRHNVSGRARSSGLQRWLTGRKPLKEALKKAIPERWGHRAISWVQSHNLVRTGMKPETRRYLIGEYGDDIRELQDLIGRDLSHWLV